jgi:hypothetical protein
VDNFVYPAPRKVRKALAGAACSAVPVPAAADLTAATQGKKYLLHIFCG